MWCAVSSSCVLASGIGCVGALFIVAPFCVRAATVSVCSCPCCCCKQNALLFECLLTLVPVCYKCHLRTDHPSQKGHCLMTAGPSHPALEGIMVRRYVSSSYANYALISSVQMACMLADQRLVIRPCSLHLRVLTPPCSMVLTPVPLPSLCMQDL